MNDKRENVASWDDTFINIARLVSRRSKDPNTQVGACIVGTNNETLSTGYNGATRGFNDDEFPWGKHDEDPMKTKYPFVVHAERNAILNFRGILRDLEGATIYTTHFPCSECAKELAQVGIKHVIYHTHYSKSGTRDSEATEIIFHHAGITYEQHTPFDYDGEKI